MNDFESHARFAHEDARMELQDILELRDQRNREQVLRLVESCKKLLAELEALAEELR